VAVDSCEEETEIMKKILILITLIFYCGIYAAFADEGRLKEKVILVTGGSRGVGAEVVKQALSQGTFVIIHYNKNLDKLKPFLKSIPSESYLTLQADFLNPKSPVSLWNKALKWKGHIDVLINNAGILSFVNLNTNSDEWHQHWQETLQVNLLAPTDLCREAIHFFKTRKQGGIIINVSSRAAFSGHTPEAMAYAASKAGLTAVTRSIAKAYAKDNILAYTIAPAITDTDMVKDFAQFYGELAIEKAREGMPSKEFATSAEVARAILFLSEGNMKHSTGMTFDINGASYFH
jgi:3-oxoacyl-[acyl-carrier protein] reductase